MGWNKDPILQMLMMCSYAFNKKEPYDMVSTCENKLFQILAAISISCMHQLVDSAPRERWKGLYGPVNDLSLQPSCESGSAPVVYHMDYSRTNRPASRGRPTKNMFHDLEKKMRSMAR